MSRATHEILERQVHLKNQSSKSIYIHTSLSSVIPVLPTRSFDDKPIPERCCGTPLSTSAYASGICERNQGYSEPRPVTWTCPRASMIRFTRRDASGWSKSVRRHITLKGSYEYGRHLMCPVFRTTHCFRQRAAWRAF